MEYNSTIQYDWDNLCIGDCDLNHSQSFFVQTKIEMENSSRPNICKENFEIQLSSPHTGDTPSAYKYAKLYENKKKEQIAILLKEEEKRRVFHSQPAPKFKRPLKESNKRYQIHPPPLFTLPVTPRVLKQSIKAKAVQKKKVQDLLRSEKSKNFTAQPAKVLKVQPFKPKRSEHAIKMKPFNLNMEKRLQERKKFNEEMRRAQEEKKQKEEQEKKLIDDEIVRDIRKLATFKAQSNPFK